VKYLSHDYKALEVEHVNSSDTLAEAELQALAHAKLKMGNGNHRERYCDCPELIIDGRRVPYPVGRSSKYVAKRSALVSEASEIATVKVEDVTSKAWASAFNAAMDRLAYNAGLLR